VKLAGDLAVRQNGTATEITLPPQGWGILAKRSDRGTDDFGASSLA
jgi:hypothetical protein